MVEFFLEPGADISIKNSLGLSPICYAVISNSIQILECLMNFAKKQGVDSQSSPDTCKALFLAITYDPDVLLDVSWQITLILIII